MKKLTLLLFLAFASVSFGQSDLTLNIGVNMIDDNGEANPFEGISDFYFNLPISAGLEFQWSEKFTLEQSITINEFELPSGDEFYFSTDTSVKWYWNKHTSDRDWFDAYVGAGVGFNTVNDDFNTTLNIPLGLRFWIGEKWGARLQSMAKFAADTDHNTSNHHIVHSFELFFKL